MLFYSKDHRLWSQNELYFNLFGSYVILGWYLTSMNLTFLLCKWRKIITVGVKSKNPRKACNAVPDK